MAYQKFVNRLLTRAEAEEGKIVLCGIDFDNPYKITKVTNKTVKIRSNNPNRFNAREFMYRWDGKAWSRCGYQLCVPDKQER